MWHPAQRKGEDGASAVEYGLLVAAIAAIIVVIVFSVGKLAKASFTTTCDSLQGGYSSSSSSGITC